MIIGQDYANALTDVPTQMIIAPVLPTMVSDRAFNKEDRFIVNSVLYKITADDGVAINTPLIIGTNCDVSDTIVEQIMNEEEYEKRQNDFKYVTVTHEAASNNFTIYQRGMICFCGNSIMINPGTYNTTVIYNEYKYVSLGTLSTEQICNLFRISSIQGTGLGIMHGQFIYDNTNYGSATMRFQRNSASDSTWHVILPVSRLRNSTSSSTQTITLSGYFYIISVPFFVAALLDSNVPEV